MAKMDIEVVVGCYEELLLGFRIVQVGENFQLEPSFTDHSHSGCIKHIVVSNKGFLASGGTDETIQLFHLGRRTQLGSLVHHSGSLTCLQFFKSSHLFSASEDGTFCIWSRATWECLKTFRGHKGPIRWFSLHPSGKLVLSVGQDKTLRTWNVITGKSAYITNIKRAADFVCWSPNGSHYAVVFTNKVDVYRVETATICSSWTAEKKINSFTFLNDSIVVYGGDGGVVYFHDIIKDKEIHEVDTEVNRIRGISLITTEETVDNKFYMFTASSDGFIKMFSVILEGDEVKVKLLTKHNADFRLTCMTVARVPARGSPKGLKGVKSEVTVKTEDVLDDDRLSDENTEEDSEECGRKSNKKTVKAEIKLKKNMKNKPVKRCGTKPIQKKKGKKIKVEDT